MEKVSIVVVTFNRGDYLRLTINSIQAQSYESLELIIVGDGHQPDVEKYVNSLNDPRISYAYVEHCGYPAKGRNLGVQTSTGSLIAFCDDDDIWDVYKLERQVKILNANVDISLCFTDRYVIDSQGMIKDGGGLNWIPSKINLHTLLLTNFISLSSVLVRKEVLSKVGHFIDDASFKAMEDYHLWLRVANHGKMYFLKDKLVYYRVHDSNISRKLSVGAKRNLIIFKDLFPKLNLPLSRKLMAYAMVIIKLTYYKLRGE